MTDLAQVGRLALRHEGDNWNAYYAQAHTMDRAIPLGSIRMSLVVDNQPRKEAFMALMRDAVTDVIKGVTGLQPTWGGPQTAPEHERSGSA